MTEKEERLLAISLSCSIIVLICGLFLGWVFHSVANSMSKPEIYFQQKSAELYSMATDYMFETDLEKRKSLRIEIRYRVKAYNTESECIKVWKYRCPQKITLKYLGVE